jgi:hypothetical protein
MVELQLVEERVGGRRKVAKVGRRRRRMVAARDGGDAGQRRHGMSAGIAFLCPSADSNHMRTWSCVDIVALSLFCTLTRKMSRFANATPVRDTTF